MTFHIGFGRSATAQAIVAWCCSKALLKGLAKVPHVVKAALLCNTADHIVRIQDQIQLGIEQTDLHQLFKCRTSKGGLEALTKGRS